MRSLILISVGLVSFTCSNARAYILVEDIPNLTHNILNEIRNYAQYIQQTENGFLQIENQVTMIINQATALRREGDQSYYVGLLRLEDFMATASTLSRGVGQTLGQLRQAADGVMALGYTANGLYSNLTNTVDRFGNRVQYTADSFRKFGVVNQMYEGYDRETATYNREMASLQKQLTETVNHLNADSTTEGRARYHAQAEAIHTEIDALDGRLNAVGQRVLVQQAMNANDAARTQEAQRQQKIQERETSLQNLAHNLAGWISDGSAAP
jgi:hypothetical protein